VPLATETVQVVGSLALALGIGLLLGIERERRKGRGPSRAPAGIRTFALVALLGGLAEQVGSAAVIAVAGGFVGLAAIAAYLQSPRDDPGMTTEVALVVTFLLGVLAQREAAVAAGIAVAVALVLAYRDRVHRLVSETLTEAEVHDGLLFAAAALIILPLIPDQGLGPNGAFNPSVVWRLVVIVMAVQGAGYVALRIMGPRYGLLVSGFVSGFVSSTATVAAMGARSIGEPKLLRAVVGAAVASTVATMILLGIVLAATSVKTLQHVLVPLVSAGFMAFAYAAVVAFRLVRTPAPDSFERGRAFDLRIAVLLAGIISAVLIAAGALEQALGTKGVTIVAAVAGFADSQSAAASAASFVTSGKISAADAVVAVLAALSTNTVSKVVAAWTLGSRRYAVEVSVGLALVIGAAWAGWGATQAL
jgi:uncharacterized membrane protein (DUF4010 family)